MRNLTRNQNPSLVQALTSATQNRFRVAVIRSKIWGFDSEFLMSGRAGRPEDVQTIQFSDGIESYICTTASELKRWLLDHSRIKILYGFVTLCDLGSVEEWLGSSAVKISPHAGWIRYGRANIHVVDAQPLLSAFGLRKLADCGQMVGTAKLDKPSWLGQRKWESEQEYAEFAEYAKADAVITSKIVRWMIETLSADPAKYRSAGTIARDEFNFPRRLKMLEGYVRMSPFEARVKLFTFAGRAEGFYTGFTPNVIYSDVSSLYPCSIVATRALQIKSAKPCELSDLAVSDNLCSDDLCETRYGWIEGAFRSNRDMWGLPVHGARNVWMTGSISGLYNTFDLAAAHAELLYVKQCYKPIFRTETADHDKYADMLTRKLEGRCSATEKLYIKAVLNAVSGKLGQSHPRPSERSNFLAYNILLGHSHLVMSKLFDKCSSPILAMDTDSIFSQMDMSGKWFEVSDGNRMLPIRLDIKGRGDLNFYRPKRYIMKGALDCYAAHGWRYFVEDYLKLFDGTLTELDSRIDIKHTLLTRQHEALKMSKGRWRTRPEHLDLQKLTKLLSADQKRQRADYNSFQLVRAKRNMPSTAWDYDEYMRSAEDDVLQLRWRRLNHI